MQKLLNYCDTINKRNSRVPQVRVLVAPRLWRIYTLTGYTNMTYTVPFLSNWRDETQSFPAVLTDVKIKLHWVPLKKEHRFSIYPKESFYFHDLNKEPGRKGYRQPFPLWETDDPTTNVF